MNKESEVEGRENSIINTGVNEDDDDMIVVPYKKKQQNKFL